MGRFKAVGEGSEEELSVSDTSASIRPLVATSMMRTRAGGVPTSIDLGTPCSWPMIKTNKYGIKQKRLVVIDPVLQLVRIDDLSGGFKNRFPFHKILKVESDPKSDTMLIMKIDGASKSYYLDFTHPRQRLDFLSFLHALKALPEETKQDDAENSVSILEEEEEGDHKSVDPKSANLVQYCIHSPATAKHRLIQIDIKKQTLKHEHPHLDATFLEFRLGSLLGIQCFEEISEDKLYWVVELSFTDREPAMALIIGFDLESDRIEFTDIIKAIVPKVPMKGGFDEDRIYRSSTLTGGRAATSVERLAVSNILRFTVLKDFSFGVKRTRTLYVDKEAGVIRLSSGAKPHKLLKIKEIHSIHKSNESRTKITIHWNFCVKRRPYILNFTTAEARDQFVGLCNHADADFDLMEETSADRLTLCVATWNVGGITPDQIPGDSSLQSWLPPGADMYAIGLQECPSKDVWIAFLHSRLSTDTGLVKSQVMHEMMIFIFARKSLYSSITSVRFEKCPTGLGDMIGNKGAVSVSLRIFDTSLCFVCSHLAARRERAEQRATEFKKIIKFLSPSLGAGKTDLLNHFDHVIWFGDLNYRVEMPFDVALTHIDKKFFSEMLMQDQLSQQIAGEHAFIGFKEHHISFPPTYRMLRDSPGYSNKKDQTPSWTDRILTRSLPGCEKELDVVWYKADHSLLGSDHRPVSSGMSLLPRSVFVQSGDSVQTKVEIQLSRVLLIAKSNFLTIDPDLVPPSPSTPPSMPLLDERNLFISLSSPVLETPVNSLSRKSSSVGTGALGDLWEWDIFDFPAMFPYVKDVTYLENSHLIVSILQGQSTSSSPAACGFSVLPLKGVFSDQETEVEADVTYCGALVGHIFVTVKGVFDTSLLKTMHRVSFDKSVVAKRLPRSMSKSFKQESLEEVPPPPPPEDF